MYPRTWPAKQRYNKQDIMCSKKKKQDIIIIVIFITYTYLAINEILT